jgi:phosphonate transport system permease protein
MRSLPLPPRPRFWTTQTICGAVISLAILWVLISTGLFHQTVFNPNGWPQLWQFFRASLQPDLSLDFLQLTARATFVTLTYAVCGTTLSVLAGFIGGVLTSEVWWQSMFPKGKLAWLEPFWPGLLWLGLRSLLVIPRAIHELVWGLFFVNIIGLDPLVAILGIAVPYGAIVAKVFSELLDETPRRPLNTLLNSGVAPLSAMLYTLFPQAFLDLLSYTFYRFECSIRSATVLGIIGAGGLGYEILLSLQSLRYEQLWTLFYALFILNGLVDLGSARLRHHLGSPSRLDLNLRRGRTSEIHAVGGQLTFERSSPKMKNLGNRGVIIGATITVVQVLVLGLVPLSFWAVGADFSKLWSPRTARLLSQVAQSAWPVRVTSADLSQLWGLSIQTLAMSILAIAIAGWGGLLLSFPAAHNFFLPGGLLTGRASDVGKIWAWLWFGLTRALLLICRAIPAPIWAMVSLFVLFPGILPGAVALGIHNLGILGRLMAEVTENLDQRPLLALKAQGSPAVLVFLYGVLPLTVTRFLAYMLYRWEVCMRETVIVGLVGAGGLGRLLTEQLSSFDYQGVLVSLIGFIVLTLVVDRLSNLARRIFRG